MTFKDLQKLVQSQSGAEQSELLQKLRDKPFWIWDQQQHKEEDIKTRGDCCFNHIIGLPRKDGKEKPMFEYEKLLYDSLLIQDFYNPLKQTFKRKHLWIKKAAGLSGPVKNVKGEWVAESPMGTIKIKFADRNRFGILDHDVTLTSGETFYNPMRVFPNKSGSELIFTLYQRPGMSDKDFKNDEEQIKEDLERLKGLVEKQSA